jgi:hypothetical protein
LAVRVAAAGDADLVLSAEDEAAYLRTMDRFAAMWSATSATEHFGR